MVRFYECQLMTCIITKIFTTTTTNYEYTTITITIANTIIRLKDLKRI